MATMLNSTTVKAKAADITLYALLTIDTSNTSYPDVYAIVTAARGAHAFGVSTAAAESTEEEVIKYEPLLPGHIYPITLGETVALGEKICAGAAGLGFDADTTADICLGTCILGGAVNEIGYFMVDSNFGLVI
jgi:hypothetical protein